MFGFNKRKIDSKIRFQNPKFQRDLRAARGYKRPARILPQTQGEILLSKLGLGSWSARFTTLLVFLGLVYLVFIPNVFFVKHIAITGATQDNLAGIQASVNSFLNKNTPWPQKNLLLLSKTGLKNFLLGNQKILAVNGINKKLPSTLVINLTERQDKFIIQTPLGLNYSLSGDGLVSGQVETNASSGLPSGLVLIKLGKEDSLTAGQAAFLNNQINFINEVQNLLPGIAKAGIAYYKLDNLMASGLTVFLNGNFKVIFDINSDAKQSLGRLNQLLLSLSDTDIKRLYYVDMRFAGQGYVCYKNTACVQDFSLPVPASTTTPDNINISN